MSTTPSSPLAAREPGGVVAVELALSLPLLMMFLAGVIYFGHAMYVRLVLTHSVQSAARACSLRRPRDEGAVVGACQSASQAALQRQAAGLCSNLTINVQLQQLAGLDKTTGLVVEVSCAYDGPFGSFLSSSGSGGLQQLTASALVPY